MCSHYRHRRFVPVGESQNINVFHGATDLCDLSKSIVVFNGSEHFNHFYGS